MVSLYSRLILVRYFAIALNSVSLRKSIFTAVICDGLGLGLGLDFGIADLRNSGPVRSCLSIEVSGTSAR